MADRRDELIKLAKKFGDENKCLIHCEYDEDELMACIVAGDAVCIKGVIAFVLDELAIRTGEPFEDIIDEIVETVIGAKHFKNNKKGS